MAKAAKVDPFDTAPFDTEPEQDSVPAGDEAQAEDVWGAGDGKVKVNPLVVKADEGKVTVTLKGGLGFDAPWVVIHSSDVADALNQLSDAQLPALLEKAQKASEFFAGKKATPTPQATQGGSQTRSGQPAASAVGSGGAKRCNHGEMVFRSGVSQKNGKAWSGYFCPTPQGTPGQCDPEFNR
jgi:hypothetical protein